MKRLHFEYDMHLKYSEPAKTSHFTIKCMPQSTDRQRVEALDIRIEPADSMEEGRDSFGNRLIFGNVNREHDRFGFHITGSVLTGLSDAETSERENMLGAYRHPHGLTVPGESLKAYLKQLAPEALGSALEKGIFLMHSLYRDFTYEKNVTNVNTGAEEAWRLGKGVCQDYAHILVTLCRMQGIPARYVAGMLIAEGYSHAWVEILHGNRWYALDPTNDLVVSDSHIKLGVGRDAADCSINRGIVTGGGKQQQQVRVVVKED